MTTLDLMLYYFQSFLSVSVLVKSYLLSANVIVFTSASNSPKAFRKGGTAGAVLAARQTIVAQSNQHSCESYNSVSCRLVPAGAREELIIALHGYPLLGGNQNIQSSPLLPDPLGFCSIEL